NQSERRLLAASILVMYSPRMPIPSARTPGFNSSTVASPGGGVRNDMTRYTRTSTAVSPRTPAPEILNMRRGLNEKGKTALNRELIRYIGLPLVAPVGRPRVARRDAYSRCREKSKPPTGKKGIF